MEKLIDTNKLLSDLAEAIAEKVITVTLSSKPQKQYYTVEDICELLHISKSTVHRHRKAGYLRPAMFIGRKPLFDDESLQCYKESFMDI